MDSTLREKTKKVAEKYTQQGKFDSAISEYRQLLEADPRDLTTANTLGDMYVRIGKLPEAKRCFRLVADGYEADGAHARAVAVLKKIAKLDPNDTDVAIKLAQVFVAQTHTAEAIQQYRAAAEGFRKRGRPRDAVRMLKRAADLDPADTRARIALAEAFEREDMRPEASETWRYLSNHYFEANEQEKAIAALRRSLELKPDSRPALKALAEAYAARGEVKPALDMIARALEMSPNDIDLIIILGRTFRNVGMLDSAEATFNRLFALDNSRYDYLLDVANAYVLQSDFDRAMAIVDRCIDIVIARRHKKKATALLKQILERDPDNVDALKRLAGIYKSVRERRNLIATLNTLVPAALKQERRADAIVALKHLIEIDPGKVSYQAQLDSLGDETAPTRKEVEEAEIYDSYGDYSTELLEEMVARHPEFLAARLKLLEELVAQQPDYLEGRMKLKQLYVDGGEPVRAAAQCLEIARLHESTGEAAQARRALREAFVLNPDLKTPAGRTRSGALVSGPLARVDAAAAPAMEIDRRDTLGTQTCDEFAKSLDIEWQRAARARKPVSCLMVAVDRFASFEELEGQRQATDSLCRIAEALEKQLRVRGSVLATDGTAEFFAMLPETHPGAAMTIAEAMRKCVEEIAIRHPNGNLLTASVGVATAFPHRVEGLDGLAEAITNALAAAQQAGGNRVSAAKLLGA